MVPPGSWKGVFDHITYGCFKMFNANWTLTVGDAVVNNRSTVVNIDPKKANERGAGWEVCDASRTPRACFAVARGRKADERSPI